MSANTLLTSVVTGGSNSHATVAEEANAFSTDFVSAGVVGTIGVNAGSGGTGSFCVNADASPDMGVTIKAGQAYVTATPSGQNSQVLRVRAAADYTTYTINANASGSTKYDWVYLSISATNANTPSADASNVASFVTSRSSSNTTDNGSPPTYGLVLAVITVANGASSITNGNIQDKRIGSSLTTATASSSTGWNALGQVPNTVAANGNRSYTLTFNSIDLTGTLSAGMRVKTGRTVPAPTQCTSLNGTTQYYSKTSPAGMAQTDKITESIWIKPDTYKTAGMISRNNGTTDGWKFYLNSSGQVVLQGARAGDDIVTSYQSVPLNKWTHVSASIDTTTTTGVIEIDGVTVPSAYTNNANTGFAAPTTAYLIGATNSASPTDFFSGKIAQAASFNVVISVATLLTYLSQGYAGTETSLVSAYSFNNSINDLNANANNLTANGSALATNADSPFGGQADGTISSTLDYGIITKTAFSTNTTLTVQVPEGCTIPTSNGVSAVSYTTAKAPYQLPSSVDKWCIEIPNLVLIQSASVAALNTWYLFPYQITVPIGAWELAYESVQQMNQTTAGALAAVIALSPTAPTNGVYTVDMAGNIFSGVSVNDIMLTVTRSSRINLTTATAYAFYGQVRTNTSATVLYVRGEFGGRCVITARCAHL